MWVTGSFLWFGAYSSFTCTHLGITRQAVPDYLWLVHRLLTYQRDSAWPGCYWVRLGLGSSPGLLMLGWTPVCRQNFLHFCWQRFNKALKTFLRDLVRVDMIASWCKFPVPPHPKFYLLDLRIVIWLLIPLEALVIRWAHCGYKGMDVVRLAVKLLWLAD